MRFREIRKGVILTELKMSPSFLAKLVKSIPGAKVGLEFEMVVPGMADQDDRQPDYEVNYDLDRRIKVAGYHKDIQSFFSGDEDRDSATMENSDHAINVALDKFFEEYTNEFSDYKNDNFDDWLEKEYWDDNKADILAQIKDEFPGIEGSISGGARLQEKADEVFKDMLEDLVRRKGNEYEKYSDQFDQEEFDTFINDTDFMEVWMRVNGIRTMNEFADRYGLDWPYYTNTNELSGDGDLQSLVGSFSDYIGREVIISSSYGGKRSDTAYTVEPDTSIEPDDDDDAGGLEFISPPLPLDVMEDELVAVKRWAKQNNCYTNESCGLHMNVSLPGYSIEKLDYVKMAIFLGDEYVADQFGRLTSTYAKPAIGRIKNNARVSPENVAAAMDNLKKQLNLAASKLIHSGVTQKYSSINTKDNRVEIRSPGGDWLNEDTDKLISVLHRIVVALDAGLNPEKYKQEYATKFYKLLSPTQDNAVDLFVKYTNGQINSTELKVAWADQVLANPKANPKLANKAKGIQQNVEARSWWKVTLLSKDSSPDRSTDVVAKSAQEAIAATRTSWQLPGAYYPDSSFTAERGARYEDPWAKMGSGPARAEAQRIANSSEFDQMFGNDNSSQERFEREQASYASNNGRWGRWFVTPANGGPTQALSARSAAEASELAVEQFPAIFRDGIDSVTPEDRTPSHITNRMPPEALAHATNSSLRDNSRNGEF